MQLPLSVDAADRDDVIQTDAAEDRARADAGQRVRDGGGGDDGSDAGDNRSHRRRTMLSLSLLYNHRLLRVHSSDVLINFTAGSVTNAKRKLNISDLPYRLAFVSIERRSPSLSGK